MTFLNGVHKRRLIAKETSIANCEVLGEKHCMAVQGIFVGIIIKAGGTSVKEGYGTPETTGWLEVSVNGKLIHSKKNGDGYVDSDKKMKKIIKAIEDAVKSQG